jgi:arylsulfatase A-like enzyme
MIRWTGRVPAGRVESRPIIQLDVLPTALAAAGIKVDKSARLDGVDLLPFLTGSSKGLPHETLYWRLGGMMAIRHGEWKLLKTKDGPLVDADPAVLKDLTGAELYNLATDIGESKNVAAAHPEKVKELGARWQSWNQQLVKPRWGAPAGGRGNQRFP